MDILQKKELKNLETALNEIENQMRQPGLDMEAWSTLAVKRGEAETRLAMFRNKAAGLTGTGRPQKDLKAIHNNHTLTKN